MMALGNKPTITEIVEDGADYRISGNKVIVSPGGWVKFNNPSSTQIIHMYGVKNPTPNTTERPENMRNDIMPTVCGRSEWLVNDVMFPNGGSTWIGGYSAIADQSERVMEFFDCTVPGSAITPAGNKPGPLGIWWYPVLNKMLAKK
jgi:hypothetical protein